MGTQNFLWLFAKRSVTGALIGVTISDRYVTISAVSGSSMHPTFEANPTSFPGSLRGDIVLAERFCLERYKFSRGDVVIFQAPDNHNKTLVMRIIALPGQLVRVPESSEMLKIPEGHCWVEDATGAYERKGDTCDLASTKNGRCRVKDANWEDASMLSVTYFEVLLPMAPHLKDWII